VIDATILIPTFRHASLLPYAVRSALEQQGASFELFVVGDGVEDDTREALAPFLEDERVTFFDNPKGERHGEAHRHAALAGARGRIVCYLSDDDLLHPEHVAEMCRLLESADFAHSAPFLVDPDGSLRFAAIDLENPGFYPLLLNERWNRVVLTGAAHTLAAYRRLPYGWRPAPPDVWSDLHMWRQFLELPGLRARTGTRITALHFADQDRKELSMDERVAELELWWARLHEPGFDAWIEREACRVLRRMAVRHELRIQQLKRRVAALETSRWDALRARVGRVRRRALRGWRRGAR
jgi:glycosyltransferase involved in cell wall biosynthesis